MEISLARLGRRLPVRRKNGTPAQRQLSTKTCSATKVSVRDLGSTPGLSVAGSRRTRAPPTTLRVDLSPRRAAIGRSDCRISSFSSRMTSASSECGGSIATSDEQLQHVVLHHVAQRAGLLVIAGARADAFFLRHRDLHVVDVPLVEQRLEDAVGEAQHQDVLDGLLAEVVVDPVDLPLVEAPRRSRR